MKHLKFALVIVTVLFLSACTSTGSLFGKKDKSADGADAGADTGAESMGLESEGQLAVDPLSDPASILSNRVIYFDFDKSDVRPEFVDIVVAHGRYLADNPSLTMRLEGHADERGTREYNVALSERRANAVRSQLMVQGARAEQIQVISYGEEMPVAFGHDEESWRLNRRAEIIYEGR